MIASQIVCDGCGKTEPVPSGQRIHVARAALHVLGWQQRPGGRDLCHWCVASESARRKEIRNV
jgi:hypothetical protein